MNKNVILSLLLLALIISSPLSVIKNENIKSNYNDFKIDNLFAFAEEKYKDDGDDNDNEYSSYSPTNQLIYKDKNKIDKDKKPHYSYHSSIKKGGIPECKQCFLSELKKLDKKTADYILDVIGKKFNGLTKFCKLVANGNIDRVELEEILNFIVFYDDDHKNYDRKQKYYHQTEYNEHDKQYNSKDNERKGEGILYSNKNDYNTYSENNYYKENSNDFKKVNYDEDDIKYSNNNNHKYNDKNYLNNNNRYNDNYNSKDIKEQFIQKVLNCLFERIQRVYVLWEDNTSGNKDIYLKISKDNGRTFEPVINLSNNIGDSVNAQMAVYGNNVYVVWEDTSNGGDKNIFFRASHDYGQTFDPIIDLSNNTLTSISPHIAVSGNNVYVGWKDGTGTLFIASHDNGRTFDPIIIIGGGGSPIILVSGNNVYVSWSEGDDELSLIFRASHDNGRTFDPSINLSPADDISTSKIIVSGNNVYVVVVDLGRSGDDVYFRVSNDNGRTFGPVINLSNNPGISSFPDIAVSGNNVYIVWRDGGDIFFRTSHDNGKTFEKVINLSHNDGNSFRPQIVVSTQNVYVVWVDDSNGGDWDIFFRASTDNGKKFEDIIDLSKNVGTSEDPQIVSYRNNVYVVWVEENEPADPDIFFRVSHNNGDRFNPVIDLSNNNGDSDFPQLIASHDNVYVAWRDTSNGGDTDIFFRASHNYGDRFNPVIDLSNNNGDAGEPDMLVGKKHYRH
ncbi:MAG TPA: sialidase family protein [Nitrososphaeraceae archaeon]